MSIELAINFIFLCGDYDEQPDDQEIRTLRNKQIIKNLWEYGYKEVIWKEIKSEDEIEPIRLPELQI